MAFVCVSDRDEFDGFDQVVINANGSSYWFYCIKANRSINPKAIRKADELIVLGLPSEQTEEKLKKLGINIHDLKLPAKLDFSNLFVGD